MSITGWVWRPQAGWLQIRSSFERIPPLIRKADATAGVVLTMPLLYEGPCVQNHACLAGCVEICVSRNQGFKPSEVRELGLLIVFF